MAYKSTLNSGLKSDGGGCQKFTRKGKNKLDLKASNIVVQVTGVAVFEAMIFYSCMIQVKKAKPPPHAGRNGPPDHSLSRRRPYGNVLLHENHEEYECN